MAGIGEALAVAGILEPAFKARFETYGCYKSRRNSARISKRQNVVCGVRWRGCDTRINNLLSTPEDGTQLASTAKWTLQGTRSNFERCEVLMKKHGEPETSKFNGV